MPAEGRSASARRGCATVASSGPGRRRDRRVGVRSPTVRLSRRLIGRPAGGRAVRCLGGEPDQRGGRALLGERGFCRRGIRARNCCCGLIWSRHCRRASGGLRGKRHGRLGGPVVLLRKRHRAFPLCRYSVRGQRTSCTGPRGGPYPSSHRGRGTINWRYLRWTLAPPGEPLGRHRDTPIRPDPFGRSHVPVRIRCSVQQLEGLTGSQVIESLQSGREELSKGRRNRSTCRVRWDCATNGFFSDIELGLRLVTKDGVACGDRFRGHLRSPAHESRRRKTGLGGRSTSRSW